MKKAAFAAFRRLPRPARIAIIHAIAPNFTVGVVAVLTREDGRLLLVEQRHTGGWALPGGLLARHEDAYDGIVREVREEVAVSLDRNQLPVPHAAIAPGPRRADVVFRLSAGNGFEPHIGEDDAEVLGVGWFALDSLPEVTQPTLDILRSVRVLPAV